MIFYFRPPHAFSPLQGMGNLMGHEGAAGMCTGTIFAIGEGDGVAEAKGTSIDRSGGCIGCATCVEPNV